MQVTNVPTSVLRGALVATNARFQVKVMREDKVAKAVVEAEKLVKVRPTRRSRERLDEVREKWERIKAELVVMEEEARRKLRAHLRKERRKRVIMAIRLRNQKKREREAKKKQDRIDKEKFSCAKKNMYKALKEEQQDKKFKSRMLALFRKESLLPLLKKKAARKHVLKKEKIARDLRRAKRKRRVRLAASGPVRAWHLFVRNETLGTNKSDLTEIYDKWRKLPSSEKKTLEEEAQRNLKKRHIIKQELKQVANGYAMFTKTHFSKVYQEELKRGAGKKAAFRAATTGVAKMYKALKKQNSACSTSEVLSLLDQPDVAHCVQAAADVSTEGKFEGCHRDQECGRM